jgi:hypothetical protein
MPWQSLGRLADAARWGGVLLFTVVAALPAAGETSPFEALVGSWSGTGFVKISGGGRERIKCNASWELPNPSRVEAQLTCASSSYKIVVSAHLEYRDGAITGAWHEATRDVEGSISGRAEGSRLLLSMSGIIVATLTIDTNGDRQSVLIQLQGAKFESASANMTRNISTAKPK